MSGPSVEKNLVTLEEVLLRLKDAGLHHKKEECIFLAPCVMYLGHRIDAKGLHPMVEKVRAVQEAPRPRNVLELKSYLVLLFYSSNSYQTFLQCQLHSISLSSMKSSGIGPQAE